MNYGLSCKDESKNHSHALWAPMVSDKKKKKRDMIYTNVSRTCLHISQGSAHMQIIVTELNFNIQCITKLKQEILNVKYT